MWVGRMRWFVSGTPNPSQGSGVWGPGRCCSCCHDWRRTKRKSTPGSNAYYSWEVRIKVSRNSSAATLYSDNRTKNHHQFPLSLRSVVPPPRPPSHEGASSLQHLGKIPLPGRCAGDSQLSLPWGGGGKQRGVSLPLFSNGRFHIPDAEWRGFSKTASCLPACRARQSARGL